MPTAILSVSTGRRYIYDEIIACVKNGDDRKQFERMCISMISHPDSNDDTLYVLLERWVRGVPHIPVSILSNPATLDYDDLVRMRDLGADIFTVALDAVMPEIFDRAGNPRSGAEDPRHRRPQSHVCVLPGARLADGRLETGAARSVAAGATGAFSH